MNENERYMRSVAVRDVPWHRLTTPYGRASEFPRFFAVLETMRDRAAADEALYELTIHTEHQSTLWHATPFAIIFLTRIFRRALEEQERNATARDIAAQLLEHFLLIAECVHDGSEMAHADPLPYFSDLLREEYLWSKVYDEDADERRWEDDDVFPDDLFYSFYYYSYQALLSCRSVLGQAEGSPLGARAAQLEEMLRRR